MEISVVIPTFNRCASLHRTLRSLEDQSLPTEFWEVVIADDGSTDGTEALASEVYAFPMKYFRHENQGSAAARNLGANCSTGNVLVYIDDDIEVEPNFLLSLLEAHQAHDRAIIQGSLVTQPVQLVTTFQKLYAQITSTPVIPEGKVTEISYRDCLSGFFSVKREHYFEIGGMQDIGGDGRTAWGDVDFGFRAYKMGFRFYQIGGATGYHHDASLSDLWTYAERWERAAYAAGKLVHRYPELSSQLPMFEDKSPVAWGKDPLRQVVSKSIHRLMSGHFPVQIIHRVVGFIDRHVTAQLVLRPLYRLVLGVHLTRGYRAGLRDYRFDSQAQ